MERISCGGIDYAEKVGGCGLYASVCEWENSAIHCFVLLFFRQGAFRMPSEIAWGKSIIANFFSVLFLSSKVCTPFVWCWYKMHACMFLFFVWKRKEERPKIPVLTPFSNIVPFSLSFISPQLTPRLLFLSNLCWKSLKKSI